AAAAAARGLLAAAACRAATSQPAASGNPPPAAAGCSRPAEKPAPLRGPGRAAFAPAVAGSCTDTSPCWLPGEFSPGLLHHVGVQVCVAPRHLLHAVLALHALACLCSQRLPRRGIKQQRSKRLRQRWGV